MIRPLHFVRPDAKYSSCGSASALPPPSLGVSSLDLGRWRASGLFFVLGAFFARAIDPGQPCGLRIAAAAIWLLSFVQCGGTCCGAATSSLPLPVVGVSSLDLGRWRCWWPFFFVILFRS